MRPVICPVITFLASTPRSSGIQSFSGITIHDYTFSRCLRSYDSHMSKKVTLRNSSFHMPGGLSYHEGKYFLSVYADSHIDAYYNYASDVDKDVAMQLVMPKNWLGSVIWFMA